MSRWINTMDRTVTFQACRLGARGLPAALVALLLVGCGALGGDRPIYVQSEEIQPLQVPRGLSQPRFENQFEIPGYSLPELAAAGDESLPPRVLSSAEAEAARSRIRFGPTGLYLEVDDEAASVWRRLGFALNRGGMSVEQVLTDQRRYAVKFSHEPIEVSRRGRLSRMLLFWRAPKFLDYSGRYLIEVQRETPERTRVAILGNSGEVLPMQQAEFVLAALQKRLG